MKHDIDKAFKLAEKFWQAKFETADISSHTTEKGDMLENSWLEFFRGTLPSRYKVDRGFVISADDNKSKQMDCIVYDSTYTPVLFQEHSVLYIPAEAVHAVFEVKQTVTPAHIKDAANGVESVRALHRTSGPYVGDGEVKEPKNLFPVIGGLLARKIPNWNNPAATLNHTDDNPERYLDIVLTSEKGGADCFETGYPDASFDVYESEGGLMRGVFMLISALQKQGTGPAIDMDAWVSGIITPVNRIDPD